MKKKMAGMGLCLVLASSMCVADNPFSEDAEVKLEAAADTVSSTADVAAEEATAVTSATETATDTETKTANYTVSAGDFLISIAQRFLGDGSRWPEIVEANKDRYPSLEANPNLIYIGWTLVIPGAKDDAEATRAASNATEDDNSITFNAPSMGQTVAVSTEPDKTTTSTATSAKTDTKTDTSAIPASNANKSNTGAIITSSDRVLHIGDSHTCGVYGKSMDNLMRDTGASVKTIGVAGSNPTYWIKGTTTKCGYYEKNENGSVTEPYWTTPMNTPLLSNLISSYKPSVLVISLGANMVGYGEASIKSQIESLCDQAKAAGCKLVWVGPPDSRSQDKNQVNQLYTILKSEIAKYDGTLVDSRQYTDYPSSCGYGFHYSGTEGTAKAKTWAGDVMNVLTK